MLYAIEKVVDIIENGKPTTTSKIIAITAEYQIPDIIKENPGAIIRQIPLSHDIEKYLVRINEFYLEHSISDIQFTEVE